MNNFRYWKRFSLLAIASLFLIAPRCGVDLPIGNDNPEGIPSEPVTLEYWRLWDDSTVMDDFIDEYTRSHKNVTIEVKKYALDKDTTVYDYQAEIIKLIADGKGPDLFMIGNTWLPYQINQIAPMPESSMSVKDYRNIFPEVVQDDFISNNRIYAVPFFIDNLMLFYNTDIFSKNKIKQPPRTLRELAELSAKLTKVDGGQVVQAGLVMGGNNEGITRAADILAALMMQYGAEMTSPDRSEPTFNLPSPNTNPPIFGAEEALTYYTQFANPASPYYTFTDNKTAGGTRLFPVDIQAFTEGKAAMMIGYSYQVNNIRQFNPSLRFDTALLPQNQPQNPVTIAGYWAETVSKNSKYPNLAWDFLKFMSDKRRQKAYAKKTGQVPAHVDLHDSYKSARYYGPVAEQVSYSKSWYHQNTLEVEAVFSRMIDNVLKFNIAPKVAIDTAVSELKRLK